MSTTYNVIASGDTTPFMYNGKFENTMAFYGDFNSGKTVKAQVSYDDTTYIDLPEASATANTIKTFKIAGPVKMRFNANDTVNVKVTIG